MAFVALCSAALSLVLRAGCLPKAARFKRVLAGNAGSMQKGGIR